MHPMLICTAHTVSPSAYQRLCFIVLLIICISSVPDSFNMDELSAMLESAPNEKCFTTVGCNDDDELTPGLLKVSLMTLELATEKCKDPLVHKVMAMMIVSRMIAWHNTMAEHQLEEGNLESAACWYRDGGKFQAMMDSFVNIGIGPDDYTCNHE